MDEAIQERVNKGRNEVKVKLLAGNLGFGTWQATSLASATCWQRSYQVQIRSLDQRSNYCTCPDLASNRLGTCKHIEAVLHYTKKQPDYKKLKAAGCPVSFVYLAWESATGPLLRLQRAAKMADDLAVLLVEFLNLQDQFIGRLPEDFYRFSQLMFGRGDFLLADKMGLGKTLQAIAASNWLADHAEVKRTLIVCPASLKHQWVREIAKFIGRSMQIMHGGPDQRGGQCRSGALFYIVNYELVLRDLSIISE